MITLKNKFGYYFKLLTYIMMGLLGSTKNKIVKGETGENVPHL